MHLVHDGGGGGGLGDGGGGLGGGDGGGLGDGDGGGLGGGDGIGGGDGGKERYTWPATYFTATSFPSRRYEYARAYAIAPSKPGAEA